MSLASFQRRRRELAKQAAQKEALEIEKKQSEKTKQRKRTKKDGDKR